MKAEEYIKDLEKTFKSLGIKSEDTIYIASDITVFVKSFLNETKSKHNDIDRFLNMFIDTIMNIIGDQGTLLVPVFSWDFCKGKEFIYEKTQGNSGSLGNWILEKRNDFRRTFHPIYSFMVKGKDSDYLLSLNNKDSWGIDSPFFYLHKSQAKMLMINVDSGQCNTFEHYVEEMINVPYRYTKDFISLYQINGKSERRIYSMYVRDLAISSKQISGDDLYIKKGIMKVERSYNNTFRLLNLADSVKIVAEDMFVNDGRSFYDFDNYVLDWRTGRTHEDDLIRNAE